MSLPTSEDEVRRYALLVEQLGDELGRPDRGWQAATASKLGVSRSLISKVVKGDLAGVGAGAIGHAILALKLRREFFTTPGCPEYRDFVVDRAIVVEDERDLFRDGFHKERARIADLRAELAALADRWEGEARSGMVPHPLRSARQLRALLDEGTQ